MTLIDNAPRVDSAPLTLDDGISLIKEEQAKPHIAKIGGYWRVSPWKPAARDLYYEAYAYAARLNSLAKPIESNHPHEDYQPNQAPMEQASGLLAKSILNVDAQRNELRSQLTKKLETQPVEEDSQ